MGIFKNWSNSSYEFATLKPADTCTHIKKTPNPDPSNYEILEYLQSGRWLLVKINYPDCTNYEGNKILLFRGVTLEELKEQKVIDPHFFPNLPSNPKSPVARFEPTKAGWRMGLDVISADHRRDIEISRANIIRMQGGGAIVPVADGTRYTKEDMGEWLD